MLLFSLLFGCEEPAVAPESPAGTFPCELGVLDPGGAFDPVSDGGKAELILGFQGFLFLEFYIRSEAAPESVALTTSLEIEGEDQPAGGTQLGDFNNDLCEILVFLPTANIDLYTGRQAAVAVRAASEAATCTVSTTLLLVDDDPTIHTGDGDTAEP